MRIEVQEILKSYTLKLRLMGYAQATIEAYSHFFELFCTQYNVKRASIKDIEFFLSKIIGYSSRNQAINAIRFYYKYIQYSMLKLKRIERPRVEHKNPKVLDKQYILDGIARCTNLKHKSILLLLYGSGLRISEVINLKITSIDGKRQRVIIKQSKGKKDRETIISEATLSILRQYYIKFKPRVYLFNGQDFMKYSPTSIRKIVFNYLKTNPHTLRHSFATHLIESGVDISFVSKLLGHSKLETTMIYNHVTIDKIPCLV